MKIAIYGILISMLIFSKGHSQSTTIASNYFILPKASTIPVSCLTAEKGKMIYNTTDNRIYYCTGSTYETLLKITDFIGTLPIPFEITTQTGTAISGV